MLEKLVSNVRKCEMRMLVLLWWMWLYVVADM